MLFFVPLFGMAVGGAMGALAGRFSRSGIDETFRARVRDVLAPGTSGVVMMASKITEDKFTEAIRPLGGELLKTSLSEKDEEELAGALHAASR